MKKSKLKDCCTIIAGQSPESKYYNLTGDGLPFFQGKADFGDLYPSIRVYCSQPTKIAEKDDILLSVRAPVGPTNLAPCKVCIGRGLTAIRPSEILLTHYVLLFFRYFEAQLASKGTGTTFKAITQDVVKNLEIPIPLLPEQERIVARIEELFSQLDAGVETLKKTKAQLAVYRQAVLKEAFEGRLTEVVPQAIIRLGDYIETPRYGTSKKCSYDSGNGKTAVYRIPNIDHKAGRISHVDIKYAQFIGNELDGIRLKQGDILIIRSNGSVSLVGRAAMVQDTDTTGTFAGYLMRLRIQASVEMLPKFLLLYLQSHQARIYIENKAKSTSGVHNINSTEISDLQLPFYDLETQVGIIEAIESRLSVCDSIDQTVDTALQQAEAMRQSILKEAFKGGFNDD
ncbi:MAG: restriction endonuclease subunit S [Oscillospiraceae bacterium]|nr:restriction endonuclease subunit S [Oscillospiraceae bacterium]